MTIEQERKIECFKVNCQYANRHCIVYHGYQCKKLGGSKDPVQRNLIEEAKDHAIRDIAL